MRKILLIAFSLISTATILASGRFQESNTTAVADLSNIKATVSENFKADNSLVTIPTGTIKDFALSLYMYVNTLTPDYDEYDLKSSVAFDGNTVWFKDFFMNKMDGWAQATLSGNVITLNSGQYVANDESTKLYLYAFTIDSNSNPQILSQLTFNYTNGKISPATTEDVYLGLWSKTGDNTLTLSNTYAHKHSFNEVSAQPVVVPASAVKEQYLLTFYDNWRGGEERKVVDVARDGNDIYVSGLSFDSRTDFVKGTISGNEATFTSGQLIANEPTYWLKLTGGDQMYKATDNFVFTIADNGTMTLKSGVICEKFLFDGGNQDVIQNAKLVKYAGDIPAVPKTPYGLKYTKYQTLGNQIIFIHPHVDNNGNELNPDSLYYRVYLDGELYTFRPDSYTGLRQAMTDVPFNYYDSYTFNEIYQNRYKLFYINESNWKKMEIESVYKVNGVENVSTERASVLSGVESVNSDNVIVASQYRDLTGQIVTEPQQGGFYLRTVTYTDGRKATVKVIYNQNVK